MTRTGEHPTPERLHSPGRLEAFGDGVFAIAITLLVLRDRRPRGERYRTAARTGRAVAGLPRLRDELLHRRAVDSALRPSPGPCAASTRCSCELNLLFLFFVAFLPYPTRLLAEYLTDKNGERVAVTVYALTLLAISVTLRLLWHYVTEDRRLLSDDITDEQISATNTTLTAAASASTRSRSAWDS